MKTFLTEAERPRRHPFLAWKRIGRRRREAAVRHGRYRGVTQFHSTEEAGEQGRVPGPAELVEGRELTKENTEQSLLDRTQGRKADGRPFVARSRGLLGVREAVRFARQHPR